MFNPDFIRVSYPEPHIARTKKILAAHPELKTLFGNRPITAFYIVGIVALQVALAFALSQSSIWVMLAVAYVVGAVCNHALFVMIHECTHNLVLKGSVANKWMGIFSNLPIVFPAAIGFRKFHLIHHRHQGEMDLDADLAGPIEAKLVGNSTIRKGLWMLFFFVIEGIVRPARLKKTVKLWDGWVLVNLLVEVAALAVLAYFAGWGALVYLSLSTVFSIGLHPLGARWIQEHYIFREGQETYSYYGPLNKTCFNVGYHNEHHDLMMVPWSNLPKVRAMAPEFYNNLMHHTSWTALFFKFLFDPKVSLFDRAVRPSRGVTSLAEESSKRAIASQHVAQNIEGIPSFVTQELASSVSPGIQ